MDEFSFAQLLSGVGRRLHDSLSERLTVHNATLGSAREELIRGFLQSHLPNRFEVSTGFVFDASGKVSRQLDIVVVDRHVAPQLEAPGGIRFFACETVVAVGEVKTKCDSRRATWAALDSLRSASRLDRSASGKATCSITGRPLAPRSDYLDRLFTFLIVIDRALDGEAMREVVFEATQRRSTDEWPNTVLAMGQYTVTYSCNSGVCPNPDEARGLALVRETSPGAALMYFYWMLAGAIGAIRVSDFRAYAHLPGTVAAEADVIFSAFNEIDENEPPLLSSLPSLPDLNPYDEENH